MSKETSMFELLKERLTEEEIIKITCDYDLKFCELEEENKKLKSQLQQKENIIKEVREELNKIDSATYQGDTDKKTYYKYEQTRIQKLLETLDKENK